MTLGQRNSTVAREAIVSYGIGSVPNLDSLSTDFKFVFGK